MRLHEVMAEAPAVVAATGTSAQAPGNVGTGLAPQPMAPNPAQVALMKSQAAQDLSKKKQDLQQAIKDKEQELISLRNELSKLNAPGSVS